MEHDDFDILKALKACRDQFERARLIASLKARYTEQFGSLKQAQWFLAQTLTHCAYKEKIAGLVALPSLKCMFTPDQVRQIAAKARATGNAVLLAECTKALAAREPADARTARLLAELDAIDLPPASSYGRGAAWEY